jgi:glycosyltransferase involved in cell wall biosynthesis
MKLSIVIPVYNEKKFIREIVQRVKNVDLGSMKKEIIVVDDFSTDGTQDILKNEIEPVVDKIIYQERNFGKGAALRLGFQQISGDIVIIQDADLEYDPVEYEKLIKPILENKADVVYGSRFAGGEPHRVLLFWHSVGNKFLTMVSNMFTNLNLTDMESCYKVFRKEVLDSLNIEQNRFGFEPEITAKVAKGGWRIYEVGISYAGRSYDEGKKVNWKDGLKAIWYVLKYSIFK